MLDKDNISATVPYLVEPDSYNHFHFADWLHEYFKSHACLLCGKIHELEIHQYKWRNIAPDNSKRELVVRVWCEESFQEKQATGQDIQYTITVLPGFLIPFSRVPVPDIWNATDGYMNENMTQQQAALLMNCNSRHSFSLYYKRLCTRLNLWIVIHAKMLNISYSGQTPDIKTGWKQVKTMFGKLKVDRAGKSSGNIISRFQFALSVLGSRKMGLGP